MSSSFNPTSNHAILQHYWSDGATVRRIAKAEGQLSLAEKLAWQDVMRRHINVGAKRLRVLEIGSAAGALSMLLAKLKHNVTGLDHSELLVEIAQQRAQEYGISCEFVVGDAHTLDFATGEFDAIVAVNTLQLLQQPRLALEAWLRVLKPGGKLLIAQDLLDSAETTRYHRAQLKQDPSQLAKYYATMRDNLPLWHADSAEMTALLNIAGAQNIVQSQLGGQLAREGKWRLQSYSVGYSLFSAEAPGSIPLDTTIR